MTTSLLIIVIALVISVSLIIVLTRFFSLHAFFALLIAAVVCGFITGIPALDIITIMQDGFGLLLKHIGLLVVLGSCLGMMLEKTGAMEVISTKVVSWFGAKKSTLALSFTGIVVGIPVFCDSGFIILSRLIPSIAAQTSVLPSELTLALSTGLYTTHTLVPPTPGPLSAAMTLGLADHISLMMILGIVASIPVGLVAYFASKRFGKSITVTTSHHKLPTETSSVKPLMAFLPLVLPIVLISLSSLPKMMEMPDGLAKTFDLIGNPVVALSIGFILSFLLLDKKSKKTSGSSPEWPAWLKEALHDAGIILLIIGAGGAFGAIIKSSGLDTVLKEYVSSSSANGIIFLLIAFVLSATLKTAQGSTTTAMIIGSSLIMPLAASAGFDTPIELSCLVIAIGGGGMAVSHANDAYFWVVSQFGGLAPRDAFRSYTIITLLQGLTALLMSILFFLFL